MININKYLTDINYFVCGSCLTLAFRLRNSFNDIVIKDEEFIFYINDIKTELLKKYDGYYVITNIKDICFNLKICSRNYIDKVLDINLDIIKNKDKCIEICLIPHYKYLEAPSQFCINGVADANTLVIASKLSNRTNVRFQNFDQRRGILTVLNPAEESLNGRFMAVIDVNENKFQSFFIKNKLTDSEYEIDDVINKSYKNRCPIQKAYITQTNKDGSYNLYLNDDNLIDQQYIISFYKKNKHTFKLLDL